MIEFLDNTETQSGTPVNRKNLLAMQGFLSQEIVFRESDGAIVITNADGQVHTITFNDDGTITEIFSGEKTITKTTKFVGNKIIEVIS